MVTQHDKRVISAAQEELGILERLARSVWAVISEYSKRPTFDGSTGDVDLSLHETRQATLKGYEELAHQCYGRAVVGEEIDESGRKLQDFTYRITQANVGDTSCGILARNSPLASKLVTAQPGEEAEVTVPRGMRYFQVAESRTFDGPSSLLLPSRDPDFRLMTLHWAGGDRPQLIRSLRSFVRRLQTSNFQTTSEISPPHSEEPTPAPPRSADPTWLEDWKDTYLGDSETQSLGHEFFTRTTSDQENALNRPRGITLVEGIGGAGKTSVALGRLKFFANFSTGQNRADYGLQAAAEQDFSPVGMTGFVLSHSLKRYLRDTAAALGLERLPIRDFQEFRTHLLNQFGLAQMFRRSKMPAPAARTQLPWLRALDAVISRVIGGKLRETVSKALDIPQPIRAVVLSIATELVAAVPGANETNFHLSAFAKRITSEVLSVELRWRETRAREQRARKEIDSFDLERILSRIQQEEERRVVSPTVRRILGLLSVPDLFLAAVRDERFAEIAQRAFVHPNKDVSKDVATSVSDLRRLLSSQDDAGWYSLTDADLTALIAVAALIADGFDYVDAPNVLYQLRRNIGVFIDEVQDFTELEVFLMGMTVKSEYNQITLSGDQCQRLQSNGTTTYAHLFPSVPRAQHNRPIFLARNFRQREELAGLSSGFRKVMQGDARGALLQTDGATLYTYSSSESMAGVVLNRVRSVDPYATVALIVPTAEEALEWFDMLSDDLAAGHRPALLSRRDDLTRRVDIHFTEVYETKGLEFDVVIIPNLGAFALDSNIGRNQAYVAISRAKYALLLGCSEDQLGSAEISRLVEHKLLQPRRVAVH